MNQETNNNKIFISACLVVFNEEKVIQRCLESIKDLADEIIVVHDGECSDRTLEIVKQYTEKIFIKPYIGIAEPLRVFSFTQAKGEWILQIDADEYLDTAELSKIKDLLRNEKINGYIFNWEMWDEQRPISFTGLQKMCLMRRTKFHFIGIPQATGWVDGGAKKVPLSLHHRPKYNNISWSSFWLKTKKWVPIQAKYFFLETADYECFNVQAESWLNYIRKVKARPLWFLFSYPFKTCLAQLRNGLIWHWVGINLALQQYVYYFYLYYQVWRLTKKLK